MPISALRLREKNSSAQLVQASSIEWASSWKLVSLPSQKAITLTSASAGVVRTVSLSTKKIKGLHENDFIMASKIDRSLDYPDGFLDHKQ